MVMFAANGYPDGRRKDTVINAEQTGWFVWNMATWELREAVNRSAQDFDFDVDEFDHAGVGKLESVTANAPRVVESPCHFECRYLSTQRFAGNSNIGNVDVVFGEVVRIHIDESVVTADGKLDIPSIKPIARMGYYDYTVIESVFEMKIPGNEHAPGGLEGKPDRS